MVLLKLSKEGKATHDTDTRAEQCCSVPGFVFLIPPQKRYNQTAEGAGCALGEGKAVT